MLTNAKQSCHSILKEPEQPRFLATCTGCIMKNLFKPISKQVLVEAASSPAVKWRLCLSPGMLGRCASARHLREPLSSSKRIS